MSVRAAHTEVNVLTGLFLALCAAQPQPAFGPFASPGHPVAGRAATVPGAGAWEASPALRGEVDARQVHIRSPRQAGSSNPLYLSFLLYQKFISPADGPRCQHYPTCSHYGVLAIRKHGLLGVAMTVDRLWQSSQPSPARPYPIIRVYGQPRLYDPVEASDFWFTEDDK